MAKKTVSRTRAIDIENANRVLKALGTHAAAVKKKGVKPAHVAAYKELIAEAKRLLASEGGQSLDDSRTALKDLLGEFRVSADLFARGFEGVDTKVVKALGLDKPFPETDTKLAEAVSKIGADMKPYAVQLADHDFGKSKQDALVKAATTFQDDLNEKPVKAGARKASTTEREAVFSRLRYTTNFLRRAGNAALRTSKARADFDRVVAEPAKVAKKNKPAPLAKAAKVVKPPTDVTKDEATE